jgi:adenylylsulfate kinase-like enzyme
VTSVLIVITGPIASGKSTVARALAHELARVDVRAAVIDLDVLEDMLTADGPKSDPATWTLARHAAATLANTFLSGGIAVVIADGSFNLSSDRAALEQHLSTNVSPLYVTLSVTFEEALRRAKGDPTRGVSRDPAFLGRYFAAATAAQGKVPVTDVVIDTESVSATAAAATIARIVRAVA